MLLADDHIMRPTYAGRGVLLYSMGHILFLSYIGEGCFIGNKAYTLLRSDSSMGIIISSLLSSHKRSIADALLNF